MVLHIGTGLETVTVDGGGGSDQQAVVGTPPITQIQVVTPFNSAPDIVTANSFVVGWM